MRSILAFAAVLLIAATASAQVKIQMICDNTDASSSAVGTLLLQKIAANPTFLLVKDEGKEMAVITGYRETTSDPFSCFCAASKRLAGPGRLPAISGG